MVNEEFMHLSDAEKQLKFKCALRSKTDGRLFDSELDDIILSAPIKRQYEIRVYYSASNFRSILALPDGVRGRTVLGQVIAGSVEHSGDLYCTERAAAIITKELANPEGVNQIHIFIPPERIERGNGCV